MAGTRPRGPGPGCVLAGLVLASFPAGAATRVVPADFPTIQEAVDASAGGDTVLVLPGTYVENITILRDVVVRSAGGPAVTVIDGGAAAAPVVAFMGASRLAGGSIEGFALRNGSGWARGNSRFGGGVLVIETLAPGPLVRDNWIHDNVLEAPNENAGAGIYVSVASADSLGEWHAAARIVSNRIYGNRIPTGVGERAAGMMAFGPDSILVEGNEIYGNQVLGTPPPVPPFNSRDDFPGGVQVGGNGTVRNNIIACNTGWFPSGIMTSCVMEHNTVVGNFSFDGAIGPAVAISGGGDYLGILERNIISDNSGAGLFCSQSQQHPPPPTVYEISCNDIQGNAPGGEVIHGEIRLGRYSDCGPVIGVNGNISEIPQYGRAGCAPDPDNWCLGPGSPLLPENSPPGCGLIGAMGACPGIAVRDEAPPAARNPLDAPPPRPNPFAERTSIPFHLAAGAEVEVAIHDVSGRRLRVLESGWLGPGDHVLEWDGRMAGGGRAPSGAYVAWIRAGGREVARTLLLVR